MTLYKDHWLVVYKPYEVLTIYLSHNYCWTDVQVLDGLYL